MDTFTTPKPKRMGRVPKNPDCPKNAAKRAAYHRKIARLRADPEGYQKRLDEKAAYQRAYRQTEGGFVVVAAAEARWKAANPTYGREQYRTVIRPQVVERVEEIVRYFDNLPQELRLGFVANLCEERVTDYITMFAMQWATVRDRLHPHLVAIAEEDE